MMCLHFILENKAWFTQRKRVVMLCSIQGKCCKIQLNAYKLVFESFKMFQRNQITLIKELERFYESILTCWSGDFLYLSLCAEKALISRHVVLYFALK
jgi:hypothetical protein